MHSHVWFPFGLKRTAGQNRLSAYATAKLRRNQSLFPLKTSLNRRTGVRKKGTTGKGVLRQSECVTQSGERWNNHTFQAHDAYLHSPVFSATEAETVSCATKQFSKVKEVNFNFFLRSRVRGTQGVTHGGEGALQRTVKVSYMHFQ